MITNQLLMEKVKVQERMALDVNYDIALLANKVHSEIKKTEKELNLKFKYSNIEFVKPTLK